MSKEITIHDSRRVYSDEHFSLITVNTRKPCCRRETARCRCKFWSISTAS